MAADDFDAKIVYKIVASERAFLSHVTEIRVKFKTLVHVSLTTKLNLDVAAPRFPIQILLVRGGGWGGGREGGGGVLSANNRATVERNRSNVFKTFIRLSPYSLPITRTTKLCNSCNKRQPTIARI